MEGAGKAGRWPRPWPACEKNAGGRYHRSGRTRPALPARLVLTAASRSPWCTGLVGHHAHNALQAHCAGHQHRDVRTARLDRSCIAVRPRRLIHAASTHAHRILLPTIRDGRETPLMRQRDVRKCAGDLPDGTSAEACDKLTRRAIGAWQGCWQAPSLRAKQSRAPAGLWIASSLRSSQ